MFLRVHQSGDNQAVVGICDRELLGRTLTEGDLNIVISPGFFGGEEASEEEICNALRRYGNINMFGERCIALAIREGYLESESCRMIAGVPHALIL